MLVTKGTKESYTAMMTLGEISYVATFWLSRRVMLPKGVEDIMQKMGDAWI